MVYFWHGCLYLYCRNNIFKFTLSKVKSKPVFSNSSPSVGLLQFIRSTPGVLAPLIGQKSSAHVDENLGIMKINTMKQTEYDEFVKKLVS